MANPYIKLAVTQRNNSITIMIENRTLEETKGGIGKTTKKTKKIMEWDCRAWREW